MLLGSTDSLRYFTGLEWHPSERLVGALVTQVALHRANLEKSRVESLPKLDTAMFKRDASWATLDHSLVFVPMSTKISGYVLSPLPIHNFQDLDIAE